MPGQYIRPKTYNRHFLIDIGTEGAPKWAELARGITSRGSSVNEDTQNYYDMAGRGTAETETTGQTVTRSFTGFRVFGDEAQDEVLINRLYDLDRRVVPFMEYYDNMPDGKPNGCKGYYTLSITDDGSGDANARENIGINAAINGKPEIGTVTVGENGVPTFTPKA